MRDNHTFALCAYKESRYLGDAILSILNQTDKSNLIVTTATPNEFIEKTCKSYGVRLIVNNSKPGIGSDWNFAFDACDTDFVTVFHQDDLVDSRYTERLFNKAGEDFILAFTDYNEMREGALVKSNLLLLVKRLMLLPMLMPGAQSSIFIRRMILSMGCPICCPSVTFNKRLVGDMRFSLDFKCNLDWDYWERASKLKGRFVYVPEPLVVHRIHEESATTKLIGENIRGSEDMIMYKRFWNDSIASFIYSFYSLSQKSNNVSSDKKK